MTTRTTKRNGAGIYEVLEDGEYIGMINGSEHYTGERRRYWIVTLQDAPVNHLMSLKEAKEWAGC